MHNNAIKVIRNLKLNKMKNTGIWLDKQKAIIINSENGKPKLNQVDSDLYSSNIGKGPGNRLKGKIQDSTYQNYEKNKLKQYFADIAHEVENSDAIVIFGPGETSEQFREDIKVHFKNLESKVKGVRKADSMTENQLIAWVKEFFENNKN